MKQVVLFRVRKMNGITAEATSFYSNLTNTEDPNTESGKRETNVRTPTNLKHEKRITRVART